MASDTKVHYCIIQIGPDLPHFRLPGLQIRFHLQKVQSFPLHFVVNIHIPDIDFLYLLGPVPHVPRLTLDVPQGPLLMIPCYLHLIPHPVYPKFPLPSLTPFLFLLKILPLFPPHILVTC